MLRSTAAELSLGKRNVWAKVGDHGHSLPRHPCVQRGIKASIVFCISMWQITPLPTEPDFISQINTERLRTELAGKGFVCGFPWGESKFSVISSMLTFQTSKLTFNQKLGTWTAEMAKSPQISSEKLDLVMFQVVSPPLPISGNTTLKLVQIAAYRVMHWDVPSRHRAPHAHQLLQK